MEEALRGLAGLVFFGGAEDGGGRVLPRVHRALAHRRQRPQRLHPPHTYVTGVDFKFKDKFYHSRMICRAHRRLGPQHRHAHHHSSGVVAGAACIIAENLLQDKGTFGRVDIRCRCSGVPFSWIHFGNRTEILTEFKCPLQCSLHCAGVPRPIQHHDVLLLLCPD